MKQIFQIEELAKLPAPEDFDTRFMHTDNMSVAFNSMKAGARVPEHSHLHETIDFVQEGELMMIVEGVEYRMGAGMVTRVDAEKRHAAYAITDCKVINIFYPKREDFR